MSSELPPFAQHGGGLCVIVLKAFSNVCTRYLCSTMSLSLSDDDDECRVGKGFVAKIECELIENDRVLPPEEIYMARVNPIGPGSRSMSGEDFFVLYILYRQQPTRSLKSYVYWLLCCTGTIVSESTVSRWFHHAFPIRGRLCVPNLVPYDKFRPGVGARGPRSGSVLKMVNR